MSLLSEENKVIYVEPRPYLRGQLRNAIRTPLSLHRAPRLRWVGGGKQGEASEDTPGPGEDTPGSHEDAHGLHVFRPPWYAPLSGRASLSTVFDRVRAAALLRAMRKLRMGAPIVWLFRPEMADIPGRYDERLLIYHIVDEYTGYSGFGYHPSDDARRLAYATRERDLMRKADLVLVTSRALLETKAGVNPNTYWVPNGVDFERFAAATKARQASPAEDPPELAGLVRPRIGYLGAINAKIDLDLLAKVADAYPRASLVMVGPVHAEGETSVDQAFQRRMQALRRRPNVHLVGRVRGEDVARYMTACDVGLLPYVQNEWTRHIHPLKLYEYLACGLPVVSTDLPSVHEEAPVIHIADDEAAFVHAVGESIAEAGSHIRRERQMRAQANTWRQRVEHISELVEGTLATKAR